MPYTPDQFTNNGSSTVGGGSAGLGTPLLIADVTLRLPTGQGAKFPATAPFMLRLGGSELVKCTLRTTDNCTIARAQEGSTAAQWPVNTTVELVVTAQQFSDIQTAQQHALAGTYNVRDYGAVGDGVTDDRAAIQAALDACRTSVSGGRVYLPASTYWLGSTVTHPVTGGGQQVGLVVGANTRLVGDGPGATVIRCGTVANQTWIIANYQTVANTDSDISFADFTLDGNAAAQAGTVDAQYGIALFGVNGATFRNVEAKHVYGINAGGNGPNGTNGEGMTFDLTGCSHIYYDQCRAYSDGVMNTSTGFSANSCNDVAYVNCWAYKLKHAMGFTHWKCWSVRHTNCWATSCGNDGFHSEYCDGVYYANCTSGGTTTPFATNPYAASTALGSVTGFQIFQPIRAIVSHCVAEKNSQTGIVVTAATGPVEIVGGAFTGNTLYGIQCADAASVTWTTIKDRPSTLGNGSGEVWYNGSLTGIFSFVTAPAVPASTVALTNPFPFDCMIYIVFGTVTQIDVDTKTIGIGTSASVPLTVKLRQGGTIRMIYTAAPTWNWEAAG